LLPDCANKVHELFICTGYNINNFLFTKLIFSVFKANSGEIVVTLIKSAEVTLKYIEQTINQVFFNFFKTRRAIMIQKIHMHDQVYNKVDDIMRHYKRKPIEDLVQFLKHFIKHSLVI
jgi:hypothetical protein